MSPRLSLLHPITQYTQHTQVDAAAQALPFQVLKAERHSRRPRDYYTLTLLADIAAFVYAAITYRSECGW